MDFLDLLILLDLLDSVDLLNLLDFLDGGRSIEKHFDCFYCIFGLECLLSPKLESEFFSFTSFSEILDRVSAILPT